MLFIGLAMRYVRPEGNVARIEWAWLCVLLAITQLAGGCTKPRRPSSPVVTLSQGKLQGYVDDQGVWVYKGIPFAKPPVGARRWAPPEPPDPWGPGIRNATEYAPMCVQVVDLKGPNMSRTTGAEDCLMLNVWTTSVDPGAKVPVLVFIHGGAHMSGSSSGSESTGFPLYIGSDLAKQGPAVVVTITYRLGVLGFIGHRALSRKSGYGGSGNYGHMDQIRALEWVRDNIAQFGGDPAKVMIFGQSGGATSTLVMLASPPARDLFQSAIIHSMGAFTFSLADAETKGARVENSLGCTNEDPNQALACMRSKSAHDVTVSISNDLTMGGTGTIFGPNVDGWVLPDTIMSLVRSGKQNQVPVIVGSNSDEFTTWAPLMLPREVKTEEEYRSATAAYFASISSTVPAAAIQAAYPSTAYSSRKEAVIAMVSDFVYTCPARMLSRALSSSQKAAVRRYLYAHTFTSPGWSEYRAAHGFELPLLFRPIPQEYALHLDPSEDSLSRQMIQAWVSVANSGSPEGSGLPHWPLYDATLDNYLILDTPPRLGNAFRKAQCDFWGNYESQLYP
jgi:para-nitrobenzyl esterase